MADSYEKHAAFTALAQPRVQLWRLPVALVLMAVIFVACGIGMITGILFLGAERFPELAVFAGQGDIGDTPLSVYLLLASFFAMVLAVVVGTRVVHRRGFDSLLGLREGRARMFWVATGVSLAVTLVVMAVTLPFVELTPNLTPARWALLLLPALPLLLVQTGAEELVFRGYLQQQLGARFSRMLIWGGVPAVLFGLAHFDTVNAGASAPLVVMTAAVFGFVAADITARTGSIMAAWGMHFANNLVALLAIGVPGSLTGLALYTTAAPIDDTAAMLPLLVLDMVLTVVIWWLVRRALRV